MNEKKQSGKKRLFLLVLVAFGIVLWITFTNLNRIALRHTLDETIGFVKIRLEQYETDAANDRVKSLVRLLDKTVSLGNEMTLKEGFGTQDLDSFAEEQRLTGALVLDENLNVVMQTTKGGNAMPLWEKLIDSPYVHNIVDYPKKTYSTRLEENGTLYDFAAVARADAPGILITYIQKDNWGFDGGFPVERFSVGAWRHRYDHGERQGHQQQQQQTGKQGNRGLPGII